MPTPATIAAMSAGCNVVMMLTTTNTATGIVEDDPGHPTHLLQERASGARWVRTPRADQPSRVSYGVGRQIS
jgi:hypothetical protein